MEIGGLRAHMGGVIVADALEEGAQSKQEGEGDDVGECPDEDEEPRPEAGDEADLPGHHADDADEHELAHRVHAVDRLLRVRGQRQVWDEEEHLHMHGVLLDDLCAAQ